MSCRKQIEWYRSLLAFSMVSMLFSCTFQDGFDGAVVDCGGNVQISTKRNPNSQDYTWYMSLSFKKYEPYFLEYIDLNPNIEDELSIPDDIGISVQYGSGFDCRNDTADVEHFYVAETGSVLFSASKEGDYWEAGCGVYAKMSLEIPHASFGADLASDDSPDLADFSDFKYTDGMVYYQCD